MSGSGVKKKKAQGRKEERESMDRVEKWRKASPSNKPSCWASFLSGLARKEEAFLVYFSGFF